MSNSFSGLVRVVKDAEIKTVGEKNTRLLSVSLVNNVGYGEYQKTNWIRGLLWGNRASDKLCQHLTKGTLLYVSGELATNEYEKDGQTRTSLDLNINAFDFASSKTPKNNNMSNGIAEESISSKVAEFDDEIPF